MHVATISLYAVLGAFKRSINDIEENKAAGKQRYCASVGRYMQARGLPDATVARSIVPFDRRQP